jgi:hypothetical protein
VRDVPVAIDRSSVLAAARVHVDGLDILIRGTPESKGPIITHPRTATIPPSMHSAGDDHARGGGRPCVTILEALSKRTPIASPT